MDYTTILTNEYERKRAIQIELDGKINALPKGYIQSKRIRGQLYYYLQFREGSKVKTQYIPKDDLQEMRQKIKERKELERRLKTLLAEEEQLAVLLGRHIIYRPVKNIDYEEYTLFMSTVAHDYKRMNSKDFLEKYKPSVYRGLKKKYIKGFLDWLKGSYEVNIRKGNELVLDPYTYYMYFDVGEKSVLQEELKSAIPEFLNQGLLITDIQEAVSVT